MGITFKGGLKIPAGSKIGVAAFDKVAFEAAPSSDGTLWAWGNGNLGRLGDGTTENKSSPVQIGALTDWANISASNQALDIHNKVLGNYAPEVKHNLNLNINTSDNKAVNNRIDELNKELQELKQED